MKILVINGSPKGEYSITLQTVRYLEQQYPDQTFEVLHVGQKIKALEQDFASAVSAIKQADLLLFSYPVYTFIAPSQQHRLPGRNAAVRHGLRCHRLLRPRYVRICGGIGGRSGSACTGIP